MEGFRESLISEEFRESLISLGEAARRLHLHVGTLHRWANVGVRGRRLPSLLIGGRRYVKLCDLEEFLATPEAGSPTTDVATERRNGAAQEQLASYGLRSPRKGGAPI